MSDNRLDLSCLIGNVPVTIVTRFGTVYQGTVLDWDCGRSGSPILEKVSTTLS